MIIPCIDLMEGKVVQLVRGQDKALEREDPLAVLREFAGFPEIQVIDLDAAMGKGANDETVRQLCARAACRVGGGVRSVARAGELVAAGARKLIVGTAAFQYGAPASRRPPVGAVQAEEPGPAGRQRSIGLNHGFLTDLREAVGAARVIVALDSRHGRIVVKGWREQTGLEAEQVVKELEPYCGEFLCTFVDTEGTMTGTDLAWFRRLRRATALPITAAGGIATMDEIRALDQIGVHAALGMAVYTGRLPLDQLRSFSARTPIG